MRRWPDRRGRELQQQPDENQKKQTVKLQAARRREKSLGPGELREHLLATADDFPVPAELGGTSKRLHPARALAALADSVPT